MAGDSTLRTLLACCVLLAAALLAAQESQEPEKTGEDREERESPARQRLFFDSVDVDVVNVEVVVTDKHGRPVTGLTRDDFEIFEDGRKVELTNFLEVHGETAGSPAAGVAPADDAPPATTAPAAAGRGRHLVIVVDNMNISPQSRKLLFTRLREHLRQGSDPAGKVMLATLDRKLEIVLPFTDDRERIFAALDEVERQAGSYALLNGDRRRFTSRLQQARLRGFQPPRAVVQGNVVEGENDPDFNDAVRVALELAGQVRALGEQRYRQVKGTLEALGRFCEALGGMPDRKALVYLSDGLPLLPADSLAEAWTGKYQSWVLQSSDDVRNHSPYPNADQTFQQVMNSLASTEFDLRHEVRRLTTHATAQRVAFYPISHYGRSPDSLSAASSGGGISAGAGTMMRRAQELESSTRDASLLQMAAETGGLALIRSANLGELLDRVERDFATYYALGYRPPEDEAGAVGEEEGGAPATESAESAESAGKPAGRGGGFRKTEVRVRREGALVRHGKGYNARSWRQRLGAMTLASALLEVESNPLGVELEPGEATREGDRFRLSILLKVPFDQLRLVYHEERYIAQLTALVVVLDEEDGGLSTPVRVDFPIEIAGSRILEAIQQSAGYVLELEIDPGPQRVAVGLRDHFARTEATVHLGLTVGEGAS